MDTLLVVHDMHDRRGRYAACSHATHTMPPHVSFGSHAPTALLKRCAVAQRPAPRDRCHQLHCPAAQGSTASTYRWQHVGHHGAPMDGCPGGAILECRRQRAHPAQSERRSALPPTLLCAGRVECFLRANEGTRGERTGWRIWMGVEMRTAAESAAVRI